MLPNISANRSCFRLTGRCVSRRACRVRYQARFNPRRALSRLFSIGDHPLSGSKRPFAAQDMNFSGGNAQGKSFLSTVSRTMNGTETRIGSNSAVR